MAKRTDRKFSLWKSDCSEGVGWPEQVVCDLDGGVKRSLYDGDRKGTDEARGPVLSDFQQLSKEPQGVPAYYMWGRENMTGKINDGKKRALDIR